jgi:hypothetical protein
MGYPRIATVISYCTNDYIFLRACVKSVLGFSQEVVVSYCDRFFDGSEENPAILESSIRENPEAKFIQFSYEEMDKNNYGRCHNATRAHGWKALTSNPNWILFVDCDEIADLAFDTWVKTYDLNSFESYRICSFWYYREACFRARQLEDSAVLTKNIDFTFDSIVMSMGERFGLMHSHPHHDTRGLHGEPMFHHLSWVGTKERLLRKVKTWGHSGDRDWNSIIEAEFKRIFSPGCLDPIHGYSYRRVNSII